MINVIRGTTPTHLFKLPFDTGTVKDLRITYAQNGESVVQKTANDCTMNGNDISVTLTQSDTLRFSGDARIEMQIKVLQTDGKVYSTKVKYLSVDRTLNEEVLM